MFERFTPDARDVIASAQEHARRLGHRYIGTEHLLLAAVSPDEPASVVLREHGVTPERVEEEIIRQIGLGTGGDPLRGLDQEALAAIGIDLDAVRARIETAFGPGALARAGQAARGTRRRAHSAFWAGVRGMLRRRGHGTGTAAGQPADGSKAGRRAAVPTEGPIPFTPRALRSLRNSLREAQARGDHEISALHIVLALIGMKTGMAQVILSALGAPGASLRAAVLDRYRQAS